MADSSMSRVPTGKRSSGSFMNLKIELITYEKEIPGQAGNDRMIIAMLSFVEVVAELHDGAGSSFAENAAVGESFQNGVI
jgi:hypothetical protein